MHRNSKFHQMFLLTISFGLSLTLFAFKERDNFFSETFHRQQTTNSVSQTGSEQRKKIEACNMRNRGFIF